MTNNKSASICKKNHCQKHSVFKIIGTMISPSWCPLLSTHTQVTSSCLQFSIYIYSFMNGSMRSALVSYEDCLFWISHILVRRSEIHRASLATRGYNIKFIQGWQKRHDITHSGESIHAFACVHIITSSPSDIWSQIALYGVVLASTSTPRSRQRMCWAANA